MEEPVPGTTQSQGDRRKEFEKIWAPFGLIAKKISSGEEVSIDDNEGLIEGNVDLGHCWFDLIDEKLEEISQEWAAVAFKRLEKASPEEYIDVYIDQWAHFDSKTEQFKDGFTQLLADWQDDDPAEKAEELILGAIRKGWYFCILKDRLDQILEVAGRELKAKRNGETFSENRLTHLLESITHTCKVKESDHREKFIKIYSVWFDQHYEEKVHKNFMGFSTKRYLDFVSEIIEEEKILSDHYINEEDNDTVMNACYATLLSSLSFKIDGLKDLNIFTDISNFDSIMRGGHHFEFLEEVKLITSKLEECGFLKPFNAMISIVATQGLIRMEASAHSIGDDVGKFIFKLWRIYTDFNAIAMRLSRSENIFLHPYFHPIEWGMERILDNRTIYTAFYDVTERDLSVTTTTLCHDLMLKFYKIFMLKNHRSLKLKKNIIKDALIKLATAVRWVRNEKELMRRFKQDLMNRLVYDNYMHLDCEKLFISLVMDHRIDEGEEGTNMTQMILDVSSSLKISERFQRYLAHQRSEMTDKLRVKFFNAKRCHRDMTDARIILPCKLSVALTLAEAFYRRKKAFKDVKIVWDNTWSHGTVTFTTNHGKYDLEVTAKQLSVLGCWSDTKSQIFSLKQLREHTKLSDADLKSTISTLIGFPNIERQVLVSSDYLAEFTDDTVFWVNDHFAVYKYGTMHHDGHLNMLGTYKYFKPDISSWLHSPPPFDSESHEASPRGVKDPEGTSEIPMYPRYKRQKRNKAGCRQTPVPTPVPESP